MTPRLTAPIMRLAAMWISKSAVNLMINGESGRGVGA